MRSPVNLGLLRVPNPYGSEENVAEESRSPLLWCIIGLKRKGQHQELDTFHGAQERLVNQQA